MSRIECRPRPERLARAGFTIMEMIVVLAMIGLVLAIGRTTFRGLENALQNATQETTGYLGEVRARAMATTSAYRIIVVSDTELRAEHARRCGADDEDWTPDDRLDHELRDQARFEDLAAGEILTCFSSRGISSDNPTFALADHEGNQRRMELFLGGGVMIDGQIPGVELPGEAEQGEGQGQGQGQGQGGG